MSKYIEQGKVAVERTGESHKDKRVVELRKYSAVKTKNSGKQVSKEFPAQKLELVYCPSGSIEKTIFAKNEETNEEEKFKVKVKTTRPLLIGTTPITQGVWQYVMGYNPAYFQKRKWKFFNYTDEGVQKLKFNIQPNLDRPVECITWVDAIAFCNKLSKLQGLAPYYNITDVVYDLQFKKFPFFVCRYKNDESPKQRQRHMISAHVTINSYADGYRLPTILEAELIAKFSKPQKIETISYNVEEFAEEHFYPRPVASKEPNSLGLYDLGDNVFEMLYDYDLSDKHIPRYFNEESPLNRVIREKETNDEIRLSVKLSKENKKFLRKIKTIEDPIIAPSKYPNAPTPFDFVGHFLMGNTNFWSKMPGREPTKNNETSHVLTTAQFTRDQEIGFRVVRNIDNSEKD